MVAEPSQYSSDFGHSFKMKINEISLYFNGLRFHLSILPKSNYLPLCCFTGLSYIDIKTLTHDKIQRMDFDGEEWIITRRTKTRVSSNVPLMEIAKELIERYRGLAGDDLVFPMPSNSVCNTHLKQIAKACGIHKEIGFHLSRHTFATTVYLCNGGTIEALSKILGHKHISTTQIYAEVTNRMVSSDFRAISGNLAAMQRSVLEKKDRKQDGKRVRRSLRETA